MASRIYRHAPIPDQSRSSVKMSTLTLNQGELNTLPYSPYPPT